MIIKSGYPWYGQKIGILVLSGKSPRVPGDPGHAKTFSFPVRYEVVNGGFADLIEGSDQIKNNLIDAINRLKASGIEGIVGDCGLMSLYQHELGAIVDLPVLTSALCLIPLVWGMIGHSGSIGIITGHSQLLRRAHLEHSGWHEDIELSIQGMEEESHFSEIVINEGLELDTNKMRLDVISAVRKLRKKTKNLRAIILECSNLATYSCDVYFELSLPVFDIVATANLLEYGVNPPRYEKPDGSCQEK